MFRRLSKSESRLRKTAAFLAVSSCLEGVKRPHAYQAGGESLALISAIDLVAETVLMAGAPVPGMIKASAKAGDKNAPRVNFKKNVPSPQDWVIVFERASE